MLQGRAQQLKPGRMTGETSKLEGHAAQGLCACACAHACSSTCQQSTYMLQRVMHKLQQWPQGRLDGLKTALHGPLQGSVQPCMRNAASIAAHSGYACLIH